MLEWLSCSITKPYYAKNTESLRQNVAVVLTAIVALAGACSAKAQECDLPICFGDYRDSLVFTAAPEEVGSIDDDRREPPETPITEIIRKMVHSMWKEEKQDTKSGRIKGEESWSGAKNGGEDNPPSIVTHSLSTDWEPLEAPGTMRINRIISPREK